MPSPRSLFRTLAVAEAITWTLLIAGMIAKYALGWGDAGVRIGGGIHGFVFLSYAVVVVLVGLDQQWRPLTIALGLGSAVIPYATIPFELHAQRRGLLGDQWRLRTQPPASALDRLVALVLAHPLVSALVAVIGVAAVFSVLLMAGPPTQWGR